MAWQMSICYMQFSKIPCSCSKKPYLHILAVFMWHNIFICIVVLIPHICTYHFYASLQYILINDQKLSQSFSRFWLAKTAFCQVYLRRVWPQNTFSSLLGILDNNHGGNRPRQNGLESRVLSFFSSDGRTIFIFFPKYTQMNWNTMKKLCAF